LNEPREDTPGPILRNDISKREPHTFGGDNNDVAILISKDYPKMARLGIFQPHVQRHKTAMSE